MPSDYVSFLGLAVLLILIPGPDFAVVMKNSLLHGRGAGAATAVGVVTGLAVQGLMAAFGAAALVVRSAAAFNALKVIGACYLGFLGFQALRAAFARRSGTDAEPYDPTGPAREPGARVRLRSFRQGVLSNLTNPKVLAFYFSLLPQFVDRDGAALPQMLVLAATHVVLSLWWLLLLVLLLGRMRRVLARPKVRKSLEGFTGAALVGLGLQLVMAPR